MHKTHRWLLGEIESWLSQGIIEPHQAEAIRRRYPQAEDAPWGRLIISALGAIIFGLGIILFFAYNWDDMPKLAKLGVVFGGLLAAHGAGHLLARRGRASAHQVEGLHMLGTMIFGAGIWLVSQIYHFDNPYPGALLMWGLGALAMAWALPSIAQALVALVLVVAWSLDLTRSFAPGIDYFSPALVLAGFLPLGLWRRSRVLLFFIALAFLIVLPVGAAAELEELTGFLLLALACAYLGAGMLAKNFRQPLGEPVSVLGQGVYFGLLFSFTFEEAIGDFTRRQPVGATQWAFFLLPFAIALGTLVLGVATGDRRPPIRLVPPLLAIAALLYFALLHFDLLALDPLLAPLPFNLLLLGHGVVLILEGSRRQSFLQVSAGCMVVSVVTMVRFADLFESLLLRSMFFLLLGVGLLAVSNFYNRHKQRSEVGDA